MRSLCLLLLLALSAAACSQDLTGTWESDGTMDGYMKLVLVRAGDQYVGYSYDEDGMGYCSVNFEGHFRGGELRGRGNGVIRKSIFHAQSAFQLRYAQAGGHEFLVGRAQAGAGLLRVLSFGASVPVTLVRKSSAVDTTEFMRRALAAAQPPARMPVVINDSASFVKTLAPPSPAGSSTALLALRATRRTDTVQVIETAAAELTFRVFDNGVFDGDTVSILHNDIVVADRQALRTEPIVFRVRLSDREPESRVVFIAHNEGRIPPNSALLLVEAGGREYRVTAQSSGERNALVLVRRTP